MVPRKKRGPRPTGQGVQIQVRLHQDRLDAIDAWIEARSRGESRPQAIRSLIDLGLSSEAAMTHLLSRLEKMLPSADPELAEVIGDVRKLLQSTLR